MDKDLNLKITQSMHEGKNENEIVSDEIKKALKTDKSSSLISSLA